MAFLEVYVDESGQSTSHPLVVFGGYMATADNWLGFCDEWNAVLVDAKVLNVKTGGPGKFHMTDLEAKKGVFDGWTEARRRSLLGALFSIINQHKLYAIGFAVEVEWWKSKDWASRSPRHEALTDPWHWAAQGIIGTAERMTEEPGAPDLLSPEGIAFVLTGRKNTAALPRNCYRLFAGTFSITE